MPKKRMCVTVRGDLAEGIEEQLEMGIYGSKSHAVERALIFLRKEEISTPKRLSN